MTDPQGSSPLTQETRRRMSADRSPPDPVERSVKAPPATLVGRAALREAVNKPEQKF